jgi:hypothetical protein
VREHVVSFSYQPLVPGALRNPAGRGAGQTAGGDRAVMAKGTCRYCGCTRARPCLSLPLRRGELITVCAWADIGQTLCTNPSCLGRANRKANARRKPKSPVAALPLGNPQVRHNILPLCPTHNRQMNADGNRDYACSKVGCMFHWRFEEGYFCRKRRIVHYPANIYQLLKPAFRREHGYMYIASLQEALHERTWRCAVVDCANKIVDQT